MVTQTYRLYQIIGELTQVNDVACFAAVYCNAPPTEDAETCSSDVSQVATDPATGLYAYNAAVQYTCLNGLKFYNGLQTMSVTCTQDGSWSETDVRCMGE